MRNPWPSSPFLLALAAFASLFSPAAHAYDFSLVKKLPLQKRPNTLETLNGMAASHPLIRAMYTDSVKFYSLRYLLPPKFRLADGSRFPDLLDSLMMKIAATDAGRRAICPFGANSEKDIMAYFQVSRAAALKIMSGCKGIEVPEVIRNHLRSIRYVSQPFQPEPRVPDKKFVFIFSESGRPGVESYTTKQNATYLILSPETMNEEHLLRAIAHEIAVSYDQLSRLGYLLDPVTWDQGLALAFGKRPLESDLFVEKSIPEIQQMKCAFRDPALRYAATAQRAFRFEDAVAGGPPVAATGTCGEVLAKNSVLLQSLARAVSWETQEYEIICSPLATTPVARVQQLLEHIKTIEKTELKFRTSGKAHGLCQLLLEPRVGPSEPDLHAGGPRPRMGGWGENHDSTLMERALHGESLSDEEKNSLGKALSFPNMDRLYKEEDENMKRNP